MLPELLTLLLVEETIRRTEARIALALALMLPGLHRRESASMPSEIEAWETNDGISILCRPDGSALMWLSSTGLIPTMPLRFEGEPPEFKTSRLFLYRPGTMLK